MKYKNKYRRLQASVISGDLCKLTVVPKCTIFIMYTVSCVGTHLSSPNVIQIFQGKGFFFNYKTQNFFQLFNILQKKEVGLKN